MAVSIDTVYQRVLAIANKEQRGYVTPQEFNLLANQAQMAIFNGYIYDIKAAHREHGVDSSFSNELDFLSEKLEPFQTWDYCTRITDGSGVVLGSNAPIPAGIASLPPGTDYLGTVIYEVSPTNHVEIQEVRDIDLLHINKAPLAAPTTERPVYIRENETQIRIYPAIVLPSATLGVPTPAAETWQTQIKCNILTAPTRERGLDARWGYAVVNGQALHNANETTDFRLHTSEETNLVMKILELAGLIVNSPGLIQIAAQEEAQIIAEKKQ